MVTFPPRAVGSAAFSQTEVPTNGSRTPEGSATLAGLSRADTACRPTGLDGSASSSDLRDSGKYQPTKELLDALRKAGVSEEEITLNLPDAVVEPSSSLEENVGPSLAHEEEAQRMSEAVAVLGVPVSEEDVAFNLQFFASQGALTLPAHLDRSAFLPVSDVKMSGEIPLDVIEALTSEERALYGLTPEGVELLKGSAVLTSTTPPVEAAESDVRNDTKSTAFTRVDNGVIGYFV